MCNGFIIFFKFIFFKVSWWSFIFWGVINIIYRIGFIVVFLWKRKFMLIIISKWFSIFWLILVFGDKEI